MARTYKPKTERRSIGEENIQAAIYEVTSKVLSIRKAADKYGLKPGTLQNRVERFRKAYDESQATPFNPYGSKYTVAQKFTAQQEKVFSEYLLTCSKMHYGLSLQQLLGLAYEYAKYLGCEYTVSWEKIIKPKKTGQQDLEEDIRSTASESFIIDTNYTQLSLCIKVPQVVYPSANASANPIQVQNDSKSIFHKTSNCAFDA